jgi:hypothetical protein
MPKPGMDESQPGATGAPFTAMSFALMPMSGHRARSPKPPQLIKIRAMPKFSPGETVWVPSTRLPGAQPFALMERKVQAVMERSIVVDDGHGGVVKVSTRTAHSRSLGFLVLRVGDLITEATLLNPLAKSVLQYLRLLISDTEVRRLHVRTDAEVRTFMSTRGAAFSHVILIGHGTPTSLLAMGTRLSGAEVGLMLDEGDPKVVISLACSTGKTTFARELSKSKSVRELVAPFREAHGAAASLFLQTLLHKHLLMGHEFRTAFRLANEGLEGTHFRHWRNGVLKS